MAKRKRRVVKGQYVCEDCGKRFSMPAHLGRHRASMHGARRAKGKKGKKVRKPTRGRIGRPPGIVSRLGLREMSLEQLSEVIEAAKGEARRRLAAMQETFK